ncbi:hypothetical protein DNU06_01245 [Putridiphycobacter roseus]|uniref:Secretion system C-terminal sorting domain-containing protein n=1 Tax=Putridiphycobacter roseus TaxID=2219161 RepID=A0A2W1N2G4_9FLAO|nr:T9SS type A sorting domain-containing protein [Putridiphycobacter roseus]PZE18487.1 hypothetical protein DNU06_01245 [Putridiphycobacter roseus]
MRILLSLIILGIISPLYGQEINGYARVSLIATVVVTLSDVDETYGTFEAGEQVIIMQMQDDVIGANTSDNTNFGLLSAINSAGLYEVRTIVSQVELFGTPTVITLDYPLTNAYNLGANGSVQLITFPKFGSPDYTCGNLSSSPWNGTTGGVLAFQVPGYLTIGGDLLVDGTGFLGAVANGGNSTGCTGSSNYRVAANANFAKKGEGIYKFTNLNYDSGRARILNGGGGGNSHNAGGGGGGNYTQGGLGGPGWPNCTPTAGGMGGIDLSTQINASRYFMGGGGGAGEGNNGGSQNAGNGGGIIMIKANEIKTTGSCGSGHLISASGQSVSSGSGGDGNSGGGAGGTILVDVNTWSIAAGCPVTLQANGGNGGNVTNAGEHGGGGGGGQGAVIYSIALPTANTTTITQSGLGGLNCISCTSAGNGSGTNNSGIIANSTGPLPIELTYFNALLNENEKVNLEWQTKSEKDNNYFLIEKSVDAVTWKVLEKINGTGNSVVEKKYYTQDPSPYNGLSYYRLKQVDFDGKESIYPPKSININQIINANLLIYPNPTNNQITIESNFNSSKVNLNGIQIYNSLGQDFTNRVKTIDNNHYKIILDLSNIQSGIYYIKFQTQLYKVIKY